MRTFACVLKTGGDFRAKQVQTLRNMVMRTSHSVDRFVCYTDLDYIQGIETVPLIHNLPGKYSMLEVFLEMEGTVVVTGLDTIIVRNLDLLFDTIAKSDPEDFWMIKAFNRHRTYANGIMGWNGDWSWLVKKYPIPAALRYDLEQKYTIEKLERERKKIRIVNDVISVGSYKWMLRAGQITKENLPDILLFHGQPRPHNIQNPFIRKLYR